MPRRCASRRCRRAASCACTGSSERGKLLAMTDATSQGSPFWQFSLRFYRMPQVADACIELQERAGVDVNLLLFLLWQASQRRQSIGRPTFKRLKTRSRPGARPRSCHCAPCGARSNRRRTWSRARRPKPSATGSRRWSWKPSGCSRRQCSRSHRSAWRRTTPYEAARANVGAYEQMRRVAFPPTAVATVLAAFAGDGDRRVIAPAGMGTLGNSEKLLRIHTGSAYSFKLLVFF